VYRPGRKEGAVRIVHCCCSAGQAEIQSSLKACLQSEDLNSCLANLVEKLRPYMKTGLPDFNIPKTEPMFIPR
jgi:hypothetical protein